LSILAKGDSLILFAAVRVLMRIHCLFDNSQFCTCRGARIDPCGEVNFRFGSFATRSMCDRYLPKAEVQGLQKRGAQHVRIKGQAVDLSPTDAPASWER
jgi:hypothetical protein